MLLKEDLKKSENDVLNLKESLKPEAIEEFNILGSKTLYGGIKIQERNNLVYDEKDAFNYAKEQKQFIKLDKTAFEKAAKVLQLDFVKIEKSIAVTFPKEIK